jgi:hypothetical protein
VPVSVYLGAVVVGVAVVVVALRGGLAARGGRTTAVLAPLAAAAAPLASREPVVSAGVGDVQAAPRVNAVTAKTVERRWDRDIVTPQRSWVNLPIGYPFFRPTPTRS